MILVFPSPGCSHRWVWRVSSGTCPCCHTSSLSLQSRNPGPNDQLINDNDDNDNDYNDNDYLPDHQRCPRPACWSCSSHWAWLWAWAQKGSYIVCMDFSKQVSKQRRSSLQVTLSTHFLNKIYNDPVLCPLKRNASAP